MSVHPADPSSIEAALRMTSVLSDATEADLQTLIRAGTQRAMEESGYFFLQDQPADYFYILLSGRVKLCLIAADGQQVNIRTIVPGQLFGGIGAVDANACYPVHAQTLEDSTALAIPSSVFHHLLEQRPSLCFAFMKSMTHYMQEIQERYQEMVTEKVEQRIAHVLLRLAGQAGRGMEQGVLIELSFSRQELAEIAGTTLYTVSRVLSAWEKQGVVITGRERIILSKPHAVVLIAEGAKVAANMISKS
jgi:CRP-like cAMP-binding protein